jgi:hypothetical protein
MPLGAEGVQLERADMLKRRACQVLQARPKVGRLHRFDARRDPR